MSIIDGTFDIKNYVKKKSLNEIMISSDNNIDYTKVSYTEREINEANRWSENAMRYIITPQPTIEKLEELWIKFNEMHLKLRRESDWKSLELFKITNQRHYDYLKAKFLRDDINVSNNLGDSSNESSTIIEVVTDMSNQVDYDSISYTQKEIDTASDWAVQNIRSIIYPVSTVDKLEDLWDNYNLMIKKHRRESDWKSEELFGITNLKHYIYLKTQFLKNDIDVNFAENNKIITCYDTDIFSEKYTNNLIEAKAPIVEILNVISQARLRDDSYYNQSISESRSRKSIIKFKEQNENIVSAFIPSADLPYYTPEEMIDFGVFSVAGINNMYGVPADCDTISPVITMSDWFESYKINFNGFDTELRREMSDFRLTRLYLLYSDFNRIKESGDIDKINARKQSILELGWNPDIDFSAKNRIIARNRIESIITNESTKTDFVDLRGISVSHSAIHEAKTSDKNKLYPIYIVLVEGDSLFSKTIKTVTRSTYSHAGIAFDSSLEEIYSFGILGAKKTSGGFVIESIKKYPRNNNLEVFCIFVKGHTYDNIKKNVNWYIDNAKDTSYSYKTLLSFAFRIPSNEDSKMICSQFVDRMLKIVGIDITATDSSFVTPAYFAKISKSNNNIYILFEDIVENYNPAQSGNIVNTIRTTVKSILDESSFRQFMITGDIRYIDKIRSLGNINEASESLIYIGEALKEYYGQLRPYTEAKEFPVQFDDDGNLFIRNLSKLDYEAEYSKSHKLLVEYEKVNNIDGMKYELSKLWMMNNIIEKKVRKDSKNIKDLYIARAHILNDFKKYLNMIQMTDPRFNFTEYYDASPFSSAVTKINGPTIKYTIQMVKDLLKGI